MFSSWKCAQKIRIMIFLSMIKSLDGVEEFELEKQRDYKYQDRLTNYWSKSSS